MPVSFDAGTYTHGDITLPRLDAIAAKDKAGKLWLAITNTDPNQSAEVEVTLGGINAKSAAGETLTGSKVDSVNTFDAPNTVVPSSFSAKSSRRQADPQIGSQIGNGGCNRAVKLDCSPRPMLF